MLQDYKKGCHFNASRTALSDKTIRAGNSLAI